MAVHHEEMAVLLLPDFPPHVVIEHLFKPCQTDIIVTPL
jgi:hypothetical protein